MRGGQSLENFRTKDQKEASYILEGDVVNTWVTSSGAIAALALSFLRTGSKEVAAWLEIPDSIRAIERISPIHVTLRFVTNRLCP